MTRGSKPSGTLVPRFQKIPKKMFPGLALKYVSELVETGSNLTAANGSIPHNGWVELEFCVSPERQRLIVPFLVTKNDMDLPLTGYDMIEEHLKSKNNDTNLSTLMACFPTTKPKTSKRDVVIPEGECLKIPCFMESCLGDLKTIVLLTKLYLYYSNKKSHPLGPQSNKHHKS